MLKSLLFSKSRIKIFYIVFLSLFSILFNQHYGYIGINPLDNFFIFNSGYEVLNGYFPFKDYWTITGPFIDFTQALFFKIFGVSWFSYVLNASTFNFLFCIFTFYVFYRFNLNIHFCFLYALLVSILSYPSTGTPYVDHQSSYTSIIAIFCFVLALKTDSKKYWFFIPIILGFAFLTKQAPSGHFIILISFLSLIYFFLNFNLQKILFGILGVFLFVSIFFFTIYTTKIPFESFVNQYIYYPLSLGESRMNFLFPLEFNRIFLRFKLLHIPIIILIIITIKNTLNNHKYLKENEFLITLALIGTTFALIMHQLMTINGLFIFFIIPILVGFTHIFILKHLKNKKYILYFLIFLSVSSTLHYWNKYINKRDFLDLAKTNINLAIDAKMIDVKLTGLKWITPSYPTNPLEEISKINDAIKIIKDDNKNKTIVTDYQFISVILSTYDNSPNKYWFKHHVYPTNEHDLFPIYKNFFIEKLKENNIEIVYTVRPLWGDDDVLDSILDTNCINKNKITDILDSYLISECDDLAK